MIVTCLQGLISLSMRLIARPKRAKPPEGGVVEVCLQMATAKAPAASADPLPLWGISEAARGAVKLKFGCLGVLKRGVLLVIFVGDFGLYIAFWRFFKIYPEFWRNPRSLHGQVTHRLTKSIKFKSCRLL